MTKMVFFLEIGGSRIRLSRAQYESAPPDSLYEVSARRQHAPRREPYRNDGDVRELRSYMGHRIRIAAVRRSRQNPRRTARAVLSGPMMSGSPPKKTGLICPACKQRIAVIEYESPTTITMHYAAGRHRWSGSPPGTKPH